MQNTGGMYHVSASPHIRSPRTTRGIMADVLIALAPAAAFGIYRFGLSALWVILVSVASAMAWETAYCYLAKKSYTISDLSACVTGLLLGMNLPANAPLWMPVIGTAIAIILVKKCFGGLGQNFLNPAMAARAILMNSWVDHMSGAAFTDAVTGATPLANPSAYSLGQLFLGNIPGCIGEVSKLLLILGGAYLLIRRVISWRIPVTMIVLSFALFFISERSAEAALREVLSGGLILAAIFMATDYATSPVTPIGKFIMGAGCAIVLFVIRTFSSLPEGASYGILFMNLAVPLIDRFTRPRVFGEVRTRA